MVPLLSPFSCDLYDLCSVTAQQEDPMLRLPWRWPWRAPVRHTLIHRHTRLHTAAKASDRYSIIRRVVKGERGASHCSELTAETQGKLERGWVCECVCQWEWQKEGVHVSVCVCMSGGHCICHWTVVKQGQKVCCCSHSKGHVLKLHRMWQSDPSEHLMLPLVLQNSILCIIYLIDVCRRWAIRGLFKIHNTCSPEAQLHFVP